MTRCEVTDLLVEQCAHCTVPHKPIPPDPFTAPASKLGRWFTSEYPGECSGCGDRFDGGDRIRSDGEGGWLAGCCGSGL